MMRRRRREPLAPVGAMLEAAEGSTRFHMPGHKGRLGMHDTTELARTDDLYAPANGIFEAERLAAIACGAASTIALTGGSTAGLHAMLLSLVGPGETLILPRNIHHAAISACVWGDIQATFAEDPLAAVEAVPHARAVLLTRPDYYGRCIDLAPLVEAAHARGMLVLVDEAHGAHFPFWDAPKSSGALGADAWVQSAHKTLPALTGAAWLHLGPGLDAARTRRFLRMVMTSSPPFPILESLDASRQWMEQYGAKALNALLSMLADFREKLARVEGYRDEPADDPTRLVVDTRGRGYTGMEMQAFLATHGIDVEMADEGRIVCICTVADRPHAFARLLAALKYAPLRPALPASNNAMAPPHGRRVMTLRQAALGPQEAVPVEGAAGRVAAVSAGAYPPGIPWVLPGETIQVACAKALASLPLDRRFGIEGGMILCAKAQAKAPNNQPSEG